MKFTFRFPVFLLAAVFLAGSACNKFVVEDVNYSQSIESVLTPDENGNVEDVRHGISFNLTPFVNQEFGEDEDTTIQEVRLIRNAKGFYYITANKFKNVYVMEPGNSELKLVEKIEISEEGLSSPAFNLRDGQVQLINRDTDEVYTLNEKGIQEENKS